MLVGKTLTLHESKNTGIDDVLGLEMGFHPIDDNGIRNAAPNNDEEQGLLEVVIDNNNIEYVALNNDNNFGNATALILGDKVLSTILRLIYGTLSSLTMSLLVKTTVALSIQFLVFCNKEPRPLFLPALRPVSFR